MISSKSDFIHILNDFFYLHIAPGHYDRKPLGNKFWCQQKAPITSTICGKFQTNLFEFWFYTHFFNVFPHVYSSGAEADNPLWTKFWCQQKGLVILPICCKFKTNIFEVWFYTCFCLFLYVYIVPGQGHTIPLGQNFYFNINLFTLVICCKFLPINDILTVFFPYKSIRDQIWPCCKIGQGQPRVIIWTNQGGPKSPILHTKPQGHWHFGSGEENLLRVFTIYGRGGHLGHVTQTSEQTFILLSHWGSIWNLALVGQVILEKKIFENGGQQTDGRRGTDHGYTISSPMSLN